MELGNIITEMKYSFHFMLKGSTEDLNRQKKESINLKI